MTEENKKELIPLIQSSTKIEELHDVLSRIITFNELPKGKLILGSLDRFNHYYRNATDKYVTFKIPKKNGTFRNINAPDPYLKFVQKRLVDLLELFYSTNNYSHGFENNRSIVSNAELHTNKPYVLNIDLNRFFPSISYHMVKGKLIQHPFSFTPEFAGIIARFSVRYRELPQGAPTSPILSNIVCNELDLKLSSFAAKHKQVYSRYADDITFSGYGRIYDKVFFEELNDHIISEDFSINWKKKRIQSRNKRQEVTGIVVNDKVNVNRKYVRELRAMIHHFHQGKGPDNAYAVISGKLEFLKMVKGKDRVYRNLFDQFNGNKNGGER